MTITSAAFHSGEVGVGYAPVTLGASGGVKPYTWTVSAGALPRGLTFSSSGSVAGKPAAAGSFHFTVHVADSSGATAAVAKSVGIASALRAGLLAACAAHCSAEVGCATVCGKFGALSGGASPYKYALKAGYVPTGTVLYGLSLAGTFGGAANHWQFTVSVTDALGGATTITPTFYVFSHISFARSASCLGDYNTPCSVRIAYSGGIGTPKVRVTGYGQYCRPYCHPKPTAPPPSFVIGVGGGYVTVSVQPACGYPGIAGCPSGYGGILYLTLTDQSLCGAGFYCSAPGPTALSIEIVGG